MFNPRDCENTHDLRLPAWGPYGKKYAGLSHIPGTKMGIRFDLSVLCGFYRRRIDIPSVLWDSQHHPWHASGDLNFFEYRYELQWKDEVYCDVSFSEINENSRLIRCECSNRTDEIQNIMLHYLASIQYPAAQSWPVLLPLVVYKANLPYGGIWVDALDYTNLEFAIPRPTDGCVIDGLARGQVRGSGFTGQGGIGTGFGQNKGDRVSYNFSLNKDIENAVLIVRYRKIQDGKISFKISGSINSKITFVQTSDFETEKIYIGNLSAGPNTVTFTSLGGGQIELDGFALVENNKVRQVGFEPIAQNLVPKIIEDELSNTVILKYDNISDFYGVSWKFAEDLSEVREIICDEPAVYMRRIVHAHGQKIYRGDGNNHFTDIFLRPIVIKPHSKRIVYALACSGSRSEIKKMAEQFANKSPMQLEKIYNNARSKIVDFSGHPVGEKFSSSQSRLAASILTNVVYPIYTKRSYIKSFSPGKWWDCLYTWDAGFIGLGLLEIDTERAIDCLNAYLTEPGDPQTAFILHGSPVPVQIYLFQELWNRTQSKEILKYFYPRVRQYHKFLAGRINGSDTRRLKSNLLNPWHYFYNSGGWDDYPPQWHILVNNQIDFCAPMITSSHCIRTAKILTMAADALGIQDDISEYQQHDILPLQESIQKYAWDDKEKYFGYVCHDKKFHAAAILLHQPSGRNFNMGLDGAYPLLAGVCDENQEKSLISHLTTKNRLWSDIGITAVDQSAPYYRIDGYWNGTVWMPHQWFFWKTMLDLGKADIAFKIAQTALQLWQREVDLTYNCYEHFMIQTGRGGGWHNFGALSSAVLSWFGAYYRPGRLTSGFDIWPVETLFSQHNTSLKAVLKLFGPKNQNISLIAVMNPNHKYQIQWQGEIIKHKELSPGTLSFNISRNTPQGTLIINKKQ